MKDEDMPANNDSFDTGLVLDKPPGLDSVIDILRNQLLFEMPGLKPAISRLMTQLCSSLFNLDHVLIRGPRGVGKRFFVQKVKKSLDTYPEIIEDNCEIISAEQLQGWVHYDRSDKILIILDKFEKLKTEHYKYLNVLMENVRVIAVFMDDEFLPPSEILEKFQITVDVPPLFKHRADLLYFIAKKYRDSGSLCSVALLRLCAYHWPGNFRELDRAVQCCFSAGEVPREIIGENKILDIYSSLLENGLDFSELSRTIETCFAHVVPLVEAPVVGEPPICTSLGFDLVSDENNRCIRFSVDAYHSEIVLNDLEAQFAIKSFFQLVFGENAMLHDGNLFELEPFGEESIKVIERAQQDVGGWEVGCTPLRLGLGSGFKKSLESQAPDFNNRFFRLPLFSSKLTQKKIDAVTNFLSACKKVCEQNIIKLNETIPRADHGKNGLQSRKNINTETDNETKGAQTHEQPILPQQEGPTGLLEAKDNDYVITNKKLTLAFGWSMNTIKTWSVKTGVQIVKNERGKNMMRKTDIITVKAFHKKYARE